MTHKLRSAGLLLLLLLASSFAFAQVRFEVTFDQKTLPEPFTGKVAVYLSLQNKTPRLGPDWFKPEPIYSAKFARVKPGTTMVISDQNATGFPGKPSELAPGEYYVQAVVDRNLGGRGLGSSPGNIYSQPQKVTKVAGQPLVVNLKCTEVIPSPVFKDTDAIKELAVESRPLTGFYGRPTFVRGAVVLPEAYLKEPNRRFPVLFDIPGFGGSHWAFSGKNSHRGTLLAGEPFILVIMNPECPTGHHVFADSDNNGPWGQAFTRDFIPALDKRFRTIPEARFLGGHSSGGWSSLWLQVTYPDLFSGVWSTAPDSIDFRDFCGINIYQPGENMYKDREGTRRPIARRGLEPVLWLQDFCAMERPLRGEQLGSLEAVFSKRGRNGEPLPLWNRDTGVIDGKVAQTWRRYDIGHILRSNWKKLGPKLKGKIHIFGAETDTFYLEGAVKLVQADLKALGSDAVVEILPGDHQTVMSPALFARIDKMIVEKFRKIVR